jgi:hypothetical protein
MTQAHWDLSRRLELKMAFTAGMVSVVRRFVELAAERLGVEESGAEAVAMAAHELAENVAKYSVDRQATVSLDVRPEGEQARLVLTVSNLAPPNHIDRLRELFRAMSEAPDPMILYFGLLGRTVPEGESGLGLARIQAEADMKLDLDVEGQRVSISGVSLPFTPADEETA